MQSSRRQRNLLPEASATMENVGGRLSNSASNARRSPSPLALALKSKNQWKYNTTSVEVIH